MAGKPELSAAPGVQNVVVYVSDGNFAQAYAVSQQNVATFNSQASYPNVQTSNVVYSNTANAMAPMVGANKTFQDKILKPPDHHTINGQLVAEDGCFSSDPQAVIQQNGFQQQPDYNLITNTSALVNNSYANPAVKNVCHFGGNDSDNSTSDRRERSDSKNEECDNFIATASTDSGYVSVMGAEGATQTARCDSVRSETAESSCSSLSSVEDNLVIVQPHSSEMVVYDGGGVGVRPGGVVLTVGPSETSVTQTGMAPLIRTLPPTTFASVPFGWKRLLTNGVIIYISPSNTALSSLEQVRDYLLTEGTCKCGLECPLKYDTVFNFDPKVVSKPWVFTPDTNTGDLTKLCNHKRKIMTMASLAYKQTDPAKFRKDFTVKRKKRKIGGSFSGIPISQLLAQKEKLALYQPALNRANVQQPWQNSVMNAQHRVCPDGIISPSDSLNNQYLRHPNAESVSNRLINNPFRETHLQTLPPGATNMPQQIHNSSVLQSNVHVHPNSSQNNGQVHLHHQHHLVAPGGHVLSIQQGTPHPQGSNSVVNSGSVISNGPNSIIINSRNAAPGHQSNQKIFINNQQGEPSGPGRPIQMLPIASNVPSQLKQENHSRFSHQIQQQQQQPVHYHGIVQQFDGNKNVRIPFVNENAVCQLRPDQQGAVVHQQNQINVNMPNPVMIAHQQQKINWSNRHVNTGPQQNQSNIIACSNVQNQNVCERVPPLHQHTPTSFVWQDDVNRKKVKISRTSKRRSFNVIDNQHRIPLVEAQTPCPNIDIRQIQNEHKSIVLNQNQTPSSPSFMEDPSGYLAQQTALLNNTISRQTGAINCAGFNCTSPVQNISVQTVPNSSQPNEVPLPSTVVLGSQMKHTQNYVASTGQSFIRNSQVPQHLENQQHYSQTSVMAREAADSTALNEHIQCQGCNDNSVHFVTQKDESNESCNSYILRDHPQVHKQSSRPNSEPNTPSSSNIVDDPVTSSSCLDRQSSAANSPDSRPIQGGAISTSHVSPAEGYQSNPPTPSPHSLTPQPRLECSQSNVHVSNPGTPVSFVENSSAAQLHHLSVLYNNNAPTTSMKQELYGSSSHHQQQHQQQQQSFLRVTSNDSLQHSGIVTTMASGRTFSCNTITSVLAGRANTSTVSVNSPVNINVPLSTMSHVPLSQSDPQVSVATTTLLSTNANVTKSPLEMVQSVVSSIQVPHSQHNTLPASLQQNQQISPVQVIKQAHNMQPNHVLVSSGGQFIIANTSNGQSNVMPPPPPKVVGNQNAMPPISVSPMITNVTAAVTQVIPAVAQQVLGQQTVLVNALPTPFVLQPGVTMTMDGMTVGQNMQIPQIVTGNVIQQQLQVDSSDPNRIINRNTAMLSPEAKRKGKKRKLPSQTIASMLHIASQQNSGMMVPQQNFSQQIQMAHSPQNITTAPVMQALTIVPGKAGGPPQIVMNGQTVGNSGQFGAQPIINSQQTQQFNLLQPVSLLNGTTGMVQNFPAIQQFILPNLGSMVMNADGTATLLQDTPNIGMQLQLQNVNGQNVLTPVQNSNMFNGGQSILAAGPAGMVIRAPGTPQNKIIQQQHSPGAQFLSPNGNQFVVNGAQFSGQLSPLVANVSPTQQVTFNTTPQQLRSNNSAQQAQQEFIQCGQMGQTLMVPAANISVSSPNQQNTTFVQQNTTIVQQQTTMVSNNQQLQNIQNNNHPPNHHQNIQVRGGPQTTLNVDPGFIINASDNRQCVQALLLHRESPQASVHCRHSVSTQTAVNQTNQSVTTNTFCQTSSTSAGSPPDTTTHSPLATEHSSLPTAADTTTHTGSTDDGLSPTPSNSSGSCSNIVTLQAKQQSCSMAMVHCISSSEPDSAEITLSNYENDWSGNQHHHHHMQTKSDMSDVSNTTGTQVHIIKKSNTPIHMACAESSTTISGIHYITDHGDSKSEELQFNSKHFEKFVHKRKHSDTLVVMESRQMHSSLFEDDEDEKVPKKSKIGPSSFDSGDLVWGPAKGRPAWPGKLIEVASPDKVLVKWFGGDKTLAELDPNLLQTLSEGLDAYHQSRKNCRKGRKLDSPLENAIQEAMAELDKMSKKETTSSLMDQKESAALTKRSPPGRLRSNK